MGLSFKKAWDSHLCMLGSPESLCRQLGGTLLLRPCGWGGGRGKAGSEMPWKEMHRDPSVPAELTSGQACLRSAAGELAS